MSEFTNRRAVNAVENHTLQMGWFFRSQEVSDQGIDAHVEEVRLFEEDGKPTREAGTGRLIALQIKGGPSYFDRPSPNGWWFSFDAKKAQLWLEHALPVIVVLVDLQNDVVYWQRVSSATVQSTGQGFKIEVPSSQTMLTAGPEWSHIASGLEALAEARFEFALTQLPPPVRTALESRPRAERADAALLAFHLAEGRANPRGTAQSLLAASPVWIERNASWAWPVVASYAAQHEEYDVSADAFERAGRTSTERMGSHLAAAALNIMDFDRERSQMLLHEASLAGHAPLLVAVGRALLANPEGDASPISADPMLSIETEEIRRSALVQSFLAEQAMRAGNFDAAARHWRLCMEVDQQSTHALKLGAEILRRRGTSNGAPEDMAEAVRLLESAISQRRAWAGPTVELVAELAQGYSLEGRFEDVLQICLPAPRGSATQEELRDPRILRFALYAAHFLGRQELVHELAQRLGDSVRDQILKMRVGLSDPSPDEARELWREEFDRAVAVAEYREIAIAAFALANLDVDKRDAIRAYVDQSIMPPSLIELFGALLVANSNLDAALPTLRALSLDDPNAAEHTVLKLREAGRFVEAAETCQTFYAASGNSWHLIQRASCLIEAEDDSAESAAALAVNATQGHPLERGRLLTFLAGKEADRGNWAAAEGHLTNVLRLFDTPGPGEIWRVVIAQLNQGKATEAARTISKYHPVVRTKEEAELWAYANSGVQWDEAKASEALILARRFPDPKLSTALLGQIITNTYSEDHEPGEEAGQPDELASRRRLGQSAVPGELHRQAFAAMEELVSEFGEKTGIRVLQGKPEELLGQITSLLKETAKSDPELRELIRAVRDAVLPIGFMAGLRRHSYATILVQRAFGVLVAASADDDEHEQEVGYARAALGKAVVTDAAALLTLTGDGTLRALSGHFASLQVSAATRNDVNRAVFDVRRSAGSPGSLRWDADESALIFQDLAEDEFTRQLRRAEALDGFTQKLPVRVVANVTVLGELGQEEEQSSWVHAIQLAHDDAVALWSDDLGLRRLARELGVPSFGTPALVDALRDTSLEMSSSEETMDAAIERSTSTNLLLAEDLLVDVVLSGEDLLTLAERDMWLPRASAVVLTRAAWWAWEANPLALLLELYVRVKKAQPDSLPIWQGSAMAGIGRLSSDPDTSARLLALVSLIGYGLPASDEDILQGLRRARAVAAELGIPDPALQVPAAAVELSKTGLCDDPSDLTDRVLLALDYEKSSEDQIEPTAQE